MFGYFFSEFYVLKTLDFLIFWVLFDNKTKDQAKKAGQLHQLLSLVNMVIAQNGGKPFTNEIFTELKVRALLVVFLHKL